MTTANNYCNYSVIKELLNRLNFAVNIYLVSTLKELFVSAVFFASRLFGPINKAYLLVPLKNYGLCWLCACVAPDPKFLVLYFGVRKFMLHF